MGRVVMSTKGPFMLVTTHPKKYGGLYWTLITVLINLDLFRSNGALLKIFSLCIYVWFITYN